MKKIYKDIRSIRNWMQKSISSATKDEISFCTLESLTPEKISERIREGYINLDSTDTPQWMKQHYIEHPHPIKQEDANDQRLISIILFTIDHILTAKIYNRKAYNKYSGAVSVSSKALRNLYNNGGYIKHAMEVAIASNILDMATAAIHTDDVRAARTYRIHVRHLIKEDNPFVIVNCPDNHIAEKILAHRKKNRLINERLSRVNSDNVLLRSMYHIYSLPVDYNAAFEVLLRNLENELSLALTERQGDQSDETSDPLNIIYLRYFHGLISLKKVYSDNILEKFVKSDKTGRVHSNLTNFPKENRQYLAFTGCTEPLAMIDMANCQPFLLVKLIMEYLSIGRAKKITTRAQLERYCKKMGYSDVMHYVNVVENANFYKECHRLYKGNRRLKDISPVEKEKARKMIYTAVLFGDGSTTWAAALRLAEAFGKKYPTVLRVINHYRQGNHTNLSDKLQQEEAHLFIDDILTKLIVREKRPYILSLHDGFLCPESAVPFVIEKFKQAFSKSKFQVKIKVDHYDGGKTEIIVINERKS